MSVGLDTWLARIEQLHPSEIELGLERVRRVAEALGAARLPMPVITVAGTNGKGSVVALTRALAAAAGPPGGGHTPPPRKRGNAPARAPAGHPRRGAGSQAVGGTGRGVRSKGRRRLVGRPLLGLGGVQVNAAGTRQRGSLRAARRRGRRRARPSGPGAHPPTPTSRHRPPPQDS